MATLKDFDYEDIKVIGRGQYGKAHLVRSGADQQYLIAKTIDLTCLSSKERETALQEVTLLRRLDHPNIVEYKNNFFMGDTLVIIMQYCEGGDLATYIKDMLKKKMRIREVQIMNYFVQVLQALQYIHQERILHRDLKTSNLFLTQSKSVVKLGDFGISRVLEGSIEAAITVVGTPYYMSPEVCENKPYTFKSDVWSLGCVLYELCMLKHAFSADNLLGLVYKIVSDKYEPIPPMYSPALNTLIQRMLEKNAEKRPSVRDLLADPYVQEFINEYVRTRGLVASSTGADFLPHGAATIGTPGAFRAGPGPPKASTVKVSLPGEALPQGMVTSAHSDGFNRQRQQRAVRTGLRPPQGQGGSGGSWKAQSTHSETPKEAARRRKLEESDRKAAEIKVAIAAQQSLMNKTLARQMKEAEFQSTMMGGGRQTFTAFDKHLAVPSPVARSGGGCGYVSPAEDDRPDDEDLDSPLEEIYEGDSSAEEYEDDFEDDYGSEDDEDRPEGSDIEELEFGHGGLLSTVQEEQDFSRVMNNYEQDLARVRVTASSPPPVRRPRPAERPAAPVPVSPIAASSIPALPQRAGIRSRLREELVSKMGAATFQKAFDFLYEARTRNVDERTVSRELQALLGRENYKLYGMDVDQLIYQQMMSGGT